jgi:hypothetical protein
MALNHKATALALYDCFYLVGWLMVALGILLTLTFFLKKQPFVEAPLVKDFPS